MNKKKKIILLSLSGIFAVLLPFILIAQYGIDPTNYQEDYINALKPIPTRNLNFDLDNENISITYEANTDFKILQLSDTHFVGARIGRDLDLRTLKAIYTMVDFVRPDLIVYTGDIIYPTRLFGSNDNIKAATVLNAFFEKMEVPFVYEFGNHDTEVFATGNANDINEIFQSNPYCYAKDDNEVSYKTGRLSQVIEIRNYDQSLNNALILLDSGSYKDNTSFFSGYANFNNIHSSWYETKLNRLKNQEGFQSVSEISSMLFFHIPPYEYKEAYELYKKGNDEVTYLFGKNDESVSSPKEPSGLFENVVKLGSTKAMFFGHDHINTLALRYKGIDMYYGHSIDYRAYPTIKYTEEYRGGLVINLKPDSSFQVEEQFLKDIIVEDK